MLTRWPLLQMGFRPFFLWACIFSLFSVTLWLGLYLFQWQIDALSFYQGLSTWHAHGMIFGYAMAVVAGFLLTAVRNWSGVQTADGGELVVLFFLWLAARILPYLSASL